MSRVAVVILNYNGVSFLQQFLPSVIKYSDNAEIWIADNASTDNSVAVIAEFFPTVKILQMTKNRGFAGGYNEALLQIEATYYVLLNSDVEVTPNWLQPVIKQLESDNSIAACQPKIKSYFEKQKFEYAGASGGFIDKYGYPFCRGRIFDTAEHDNEQYNTPIEVFWATGACLFIKSTAFHKMKGFDSDFFAHMEEIDLCWRLKNSGYKIMCEPKSVVYHVGGGTLQKSNPHKTYLNFRNSLYTLVKNHPSAGLIKVIFIRLLLDGVAGVKFLLSGEIKNTVAIIKAHASFYSNFNKMYKKRQSNIVSPTKVYPYSIVFHYYAKGFKKFNQLIQKWS